MKRFNNYNLLNSHTFAVQARAEYFYVCECADEIAKIGQEIAGAKKFLVLGGGSNVLFSKDFDGLVLKINIKGIQKLEEDTHKVVLQAAAGEIWDDFVAYCVAHNYYGLENLSYIPGTVGAAPVQNIGAYGAEVKDTIFKVYAYDIKSGQQKVFSHDDCQFEYRNSYFKKAEKSRYIITKVDFVLQKKGELNLSYGNLSGELSHISQPALEDARKAVIRIRKSKLPEPKELPNAGSFFKNPVVDTDYFENLISKFPNLVSYPAGEGHVKLAAGQLIDLSGMKGYRNKRVGVHDKQALVLINHNGASGRDVIDLANKIQQKVFKKFGLMLEPEVLIV